MSSSRRELVKVHVSAGLSLVGLVLMLYGTVEYYNHYLVNLGPPSDQDVWEGGDVVKAIEQRAITAGTYISGFNHALVIIAIGAVLQGALVFRQTRNTGAALRALFQAELIYQAVTHHRAKHHELAYKEKRAAAAATVQMGNYGIYFAWTLNGLNITSMTVFQRPLRATINGRDLVSVWTCIGMALAVLISFIAASHLTDAVWSVWYIKPQPVQEQLSYHSESSPPTSAQLSTGNTTGQNVRQMSTVDKDTDVTASGSSGFRLSSRLILSHVVCFIACTVSVLAHLSTLSLIALAVREFISPIAAAHFFVMAVAYYAVTRQPIDSIFWGYITGAMHLALNHKTHRKAWSVGLMWAFSFSSIGILCGALQASMYLFTRRYNTPNSALHGMRSVANSRGSDFLPVERYYGVFTACMAAADLLIYLLVVLLHLCDDAKVFEADVQMVSMPEA